MQPKHLTAVIAWEGAADFHRDMACRGGARCNGFSRTWPENQIYAVQHERGKRGLRSRFAGDRESGPHTLTDVQLGANRRVFFDDVNDSDPCWQRRTPDCADIKVPFLSSANRGKVVVPRGAAEWPVA